MVETYPELITALMAFEPHVHVFGGFGLILGPLFVRLAVEALDIWRDQRAAEA